MKPLRFVLFLACIGGAYALLTGPFGASEGTAGWASWAVGVVAFVPLYLLTKKIERPTLTYGIDMQVRADDPEKMAGQVHDAATSAIWEHGQKFATGSHGSADDGTVKIDAFFTGNGEGAVAAFDQWLTQVQAMDGLKVDAARLRGSDGTARYFLDGQLQREFGEDEDSLGDENERRDAVDRLLDDREE